MFGGVFGSFYWGISMLLHMLIPIIVIVLTISLGTGLWDRYRKKEVTGGPGPVSTLKERYARGELSREEFFKMKEEISQI
ncbi:MAG: SHOCT domain-containing protein [Desulfocucumaceae bacterium]